MTISDMLVCALRTPLITLLGDSTILANYEVSDTPASSLVIEATGSGSDLFILDNKGQIIHWEGLNHPFDKVSSYIGYLTDVPIILSLDENEPVWRIKTIHDEGDLYLTLIKESPVQQVAH